MEITNPSPVVETPDISAPTSNENANAASLKDVIKQATGREYQTDEEALKGIQETYKAVTARHEPPQPMTQTPAPEVNDIQLLRHELKVSNWYQDNPQYKEVKDIIGKFGSDPETVVKDPGFQKVYTALKQAESPQKSVLTGNSRIAMPPSEDRTADLKAMREGKLPVAEYMAKYKGVPLPTE